MTRSMRQLAKNLSSKNDVLSVFYIARSWIFLSIVVALAINTETTLIACGCFFLIGGLQYGLLILMHDAQHGLVHSNRKINDFIGAWILGAPHGSMFVSSMRQHLDHHLNLGGESDPSYTFYCYGLPSPKNSIKSLAQHFFNTLVFGRFKYSLSLPTRGKLDDKTAKQKTVLFEYARVASVQLLIIGFFIGAGSWWGYFVFWLLPILILVSFFDAFRIFCEHAKPYESVSKTERLITTKSNFIERFFIAPFNMNLHAEHHLFPSVPHYHLKELSRVMRKSGEFPHIEWRDYSYFTTLRRYAARIEK